MNKETKDLIISWACLAIFLVMLIYGKFGKDGNMVMMITGAVGTLSGIVLVCKSFKQLKKDDK